MADDFSVLNAIHGGNALSAIANPTLVNPLAAYSAGIGAAERTFQLRGLQAQQAWGNALQQATGADGTTDFNKARAIAAKDPLATMGMMAGLKGAAELSGAAQTQGLATNAAIGDAISAALAAPDAQLHGAVGAGLQRLIAAGAIPQDKGVLAALQLPNDPAQLRQRLEEIRLSLAPPEMRQAGIYGTLGTQTGPGGVTIGIRQAPVSQGGGVSMPQQPGAPLGVAPGPGGLVEATINTPQGPQTIRIPYEQAFPQGGQPPTPPKAGAPPIPGAYQPRSGTQATPAATPAPAAPQTPPAATSSPVVQTPAGPAVTTSAPAGTQEDIASFKAAQAAMPEQQRNLVSGEAAMEALRLARTGPGTDTVNRMKSFLLSQGIDLGLIDPSKPEAYQLARKNLLRFAQAAGAKVGTDLGLATQLESNANVETMLNGANEHVLKQDMGLARQRVAQTLEAPPSGVGMGKHVQTFTNDTDSRGFAWDLYTPAERQQIIAEVSKTKGGLDKLDRAIEIAAKHRLIRVPNAQQ